MEHEEYGDAIWERFEQRQVTVYTIRPFPYFLCKRRPCENDGLYYTDYYGFTIDGGLECAKLLSVKSTSLVLRCQEVLRECLESTGYLEKNDVLVEMNGHLLCGRTVDFVYSLMESIWIKNEVLRLRVVPPYFLAAETELSLYLDKNRFAEGSIQHQIQTSIRENVYTWSPPVTNRLPREGEDPDSTKNYLFLTDDQIAEMQSRGELLECGEYKGYFYGTQCPRHRLNLGAQSYLLWYMFRNDKRRASFSKSVGIIPSHDDQSPNDNLVPGGPDPETGEV